LDEPTGEAVFGIDDANFKSCAPAGRANKGPFDALRPQWPCAQWRGLKRKGSETTPSSSPGSVDKMVNWKSRSVVSHDPIRFMRMVKQIGLFGHDFR